MSLENIASEMPVD